MDAVRKQGVWGLLRLRYEAWLEERMQGPAIQKLRARQAVLEEQRKTAEVEIQLRATVQSGEVGAQRHKIEWNEVNRQRLTSELHSLGLITLAPAPTAQPATTPASVTSTSPPMTAHVTDEQIEAVALRGFLQGVETDEDLAGVQRRNLPVTCRRCRWRKWACGCGSCGDLTGRRRGRCRATNKGATVDIRVDNGLGNREGIWLPASPPSALRWRTRPSAPCSLVTLSSARSPVSMFAHIRYRRRGQASKEKRICASTGADN